MHASTPPQRDGSRTEGPGFWRAATLIVLVFAVATRAVYAAEKSLVLDEFHTLYHATRAPLDALAVTLPADNHPPLSFLVVGAALQALGTAEIALRTPALLFGVLEIAACVVLARRAGASPVQTALAAGLLTVSTMHFDYGTQARMYALFSLCITVCTVALIDLIAKETPGRGPYVALGVGATAALHTHYFAFQYLGVSVAAGALAALASGRPHRAKRLIAPLAIAALAFLPWGLTGFEAQLTHELPPGGDDTSVTAFAESLVHLFAHNVSLAGANGRWVFVAGAAVALGLAGLGSSRLLLNAATRPAGIVLSAAAFLVPLASWIVAVALPRAGYTWHYILPSAAAASVLAAVAATTRSRRGLACIALALGTALVGLHLAAPATEDFRGAVAHVLERADREPRPAPRIVACEWQPALFPQGQPYDYYAPRLSETPPSREAMIEHGGFTVANPGRLEAAKRVLVIGRSLPRDRPFMELLDERFAERTVTPFGFGVEVFEFSDPRE